MRIFFWVGLFLLSLIGLLGCSSHHDATAAPARVARTSGSAVALSRDERIAVVTNRSAGIVTVFSLTPANGETQAKIVADFDTGPSSEPWASVIGVDDDTAFVLFKNAQVVRRITNLHGTPTLENRGVSVGSEPSAILITPSGGRLFIANFGEGRLSTIPTRDFVHQSRIDIDLNPTLVATGALGTVEPRVALAHPRALAITDNGDASDLDETLYATEFFSQPLSGVQPASDLSDVDRNRQGFVYAVNVKTGQPMSAIAIAPVQATGFVDAEGRMTSCFPNQLNAASVDGGRLYVTSMCTSPRGPLGPKTTDGVATDKNFKTLFHPAVFVIDTASNQELPSQGRLLTQVLDGYYQAGEDATNERMPLTPSDIAFAAAGSSGSKAYLSALGADALFRLDYDSAGTLQGIGDPGARNIDVQSDHGLPTGVAVSRTSAPAFALVVSDTKLRLSVIDRASERVTSFVDVNMDPNLPRASDFRATDANQGRSLFGTGRDIWSYKGQAWSSCESCHPGGLSDGVTWFFARGPRRTISTAGTYDKSPDLNARRRRMMLWGANIDELHDVESIARNVSGGVGAVLWGYTNDGATADCRLVYDGSPVPSASGQKPCLGAKPTTNLQSGLNGALSGLEMGTACVDDATSCDVIGSTDWQMIDAFIRGLRAPRAPTGLVQGDIDAGRTLFHQGRCGGCHGGPDWTASKLFYEPGAQQNGALPYGKPTALDPAVLGLLRTSTYSVPDQVLALNPAALVGSGVSAFRNLAPMGVDPVAYYYATGNAQDDQILCALRDVGTFPDQTLPTPQNSVGISPVGAPGVFEFRADMHTLAQGALGFNVPSLFGLSLGAPYFHAGNARTLEEVFDTATFARHHRALAADFLTDATQRDHQIAELVSFLLSIDENSELEAPLQASADGTPLALDFCQNSVPR